MRSENSKRPSLVRSSWAPGWATLHVPWMGLSANWFCKLKWKKNYLGS